LNPPRILPEKEEEKKMTRPDGWSIAEDATLGGTGTWSLTAIGSKQKKMTRPDGWSIAEDATLGGSGTWSLTAIP
jgi:hypothetical protein